jgi:hypothetical protein
MASILRKTMLGAPLAPVNTPKDRLRSSDRAKTINVE